MSNGTSSRAGTISSIGRCAAGAHPSVAGGWSLPRRREVRQPQPHGGDRLLVVVDEDVADARHAAVHLGAAHLLQRDLLAGHHLGESRRAEVGGGMAADHDRHVAQRRDVGRPGRRRPEQGAHLGDPSGVGDLVEEDVAPRPAPGVAVELLVDPGAGGVDEVDERGADLVGELLHPGDLLERASSPRAGLDGVVVGDDARRAPVDLADDRHDGVAGEAVVGPGEQPVLEVRARRRAAGAAGRGRAAGPCRRPAGATSRNRRGERCPCGVAARRRSSVDVWIEPATVRRARRPSFRRPS